MYLCVQNSELMLQKECCECCVSVTYSNTSEGPGISVASEGAKSIIFFTSIDLATTELP